MEPDDVICYCYEVSLRKLLNFARRERPGHASEMTRCLGAGTGCGWCIPLLKSIAEDPNVFADVDLSPEEHQKRRRAYLDANEPRNRF